MEFIQHLPLLTIISSFVGVVLCSLLPKKKARYCAFVCEWIAVIAGVLLVIYTLKNGTVTYQMGHLTEVEGDDTKYYWFNNVIRFGVLEAVLATAFPFILFWSILGGLRKLEDDIHGEKERYYYVLANLALVALLALVYTDDIFTGYVFLEISTLASIGLIAIKDKGRTTVAAIRYMIFNLVGSGLFLIGIVLLYDITGYFMLEKIQLVLTEIVNKGDSLPVVTCSLALITVGLGIKSGLFPFYFWMADTYGEATTSSASIISGLISKGYIFLLIKFIYRAFGFAHEYIVGGESVILGVVEKTGILDILFILGICGMIFGSVAAMIEKRINKMIAYSSAAQIGYIYMALGLGEIGMVAAIFQILTHALTKPLLFVSARGLIEVSDSHPQFRYLRGSGKRNKQAGIGFFVGAMSMIGFPATAGFIVKYLFVQTAVVNGISVPMLVATISALVISTLLNTGYFLHTVITIYSAPIERVSDEALHHKNRKGFVAALIALSLSNVAIGIIPSVIDLIREGLNMMGLIF